MAIILAEQATGDSEPPKAVGEEALPTTGEVSMDVEKSVTAADSDQTAALLREGEQHYSI